MKKKWILSIVGVLSVGFVFLIKKSDSTKILHELKSQDYTVKHQEVTRCSSDQDRFVRWQPNHTYSILFDRLVNAEINNKKLTETALVGRLLVQIDSTGEKQLFTVQLFSIRSTELDTVLANKILNYINQEENRLELSFVYNSSNQKNYQFSMAPQKTNRLGENFIYHQTAMNFTKDIVASYLFPFKELDSKFTRHEVSGFDSIGTFSAVISNDPELCTQSGVKVKYLETNGTETPQITNSTHQLWWGRDGLWLKAHGQDSAIASLGQTQVKLSSKYQFRLQDYKITTKLIAQFDTFSVLTDFKPNFLHVESAQYLTNPQAVQEEWKAVEDKINELAQSNQPSKNNTLEFFLELTELSKKDPRGLEKLRDLALRVHPASDTFRTLIGAINDLGTLASQKVLMELYRHPNMTLDGKQTILTAFAVGEYTVASESQAFLREVYLSTQGPIKNTAGLVMSTASARTLDPNAMSIIKSEWIKANTNQTKKYAILMMGNTRHTDFTSDLQKIIESQDTVVEPLKSDALYALRFNQTSKVAQLISDTISKSNDLNLRESAIHAISHHSNPEIYENTLIECVENGLSSNEKKTCASTIFNHASKMQNGIQKLGQIAEQLNARMNNDDLVQYINERVGQL